MQARSLETREKLLASAGKLFRLNGFSATSVDDICADSGIKKGAFFHHFATKEALAAECLDRWDRGMDAVFQAAAGLDPVARVAATFDAFMRVMGAPDMIKSCLAGTTLQEVSETHTALRHSANTCLVHSQERVKKLLDDALAVTKAPADSGALAKLWVATLQGSLILYKGSRDIADLATPLTTVHQIIIRSIAPRERSPGD